VGDVISLLQAHLTDAEQTPQWDLRKLAIHLSVIDRNAMYLLFGNGERYRARCERYRGAVDRLRAGVTDEVAKMPLSQ
jgi:hypothetical protein